MGNSGTLKRSAQLDSKRREEEDDETSSDDENNHSMLSLQSAIGEVAGVLSSKQKSTRNLNIDATEANMILKTPSSSAGDLIMSAQRTPSKTPPPGIPATPNRQQQPRGLDAPETITYQRSKSDSRNMNTMVSPSPKAPAKLILEDAMREVEPLLPPIRQVSREYGGTSRQPSRQPSKDHGGLGLASASTPKSMKLTLQSEEKMHQDDEAVRKLLSSSERRKRTASVKP